MNGVAGISITNKHMNKIEEIIKVAYEGDWKPMRDDFMLAILKPSFWQAIGKAKGWNKNKWIEMGTVNKSVAEFGKVLSEEKYHALRFHEINLSDPIKGWDDAINYLYELIK